MGWTRPRSPSGSVVCCRRAELVDNLDHYSLYIADPSPTNTGKLVNGTFALAQPVRTWTGPAGNDVTTVGFKQTIGANEPLRTGAYGKTFTFTLSTTNP